MLMLCVCAVAAIVVAPPAGAEPSDDDTTTVISGGPVPAVGGINTNIVRGVEQGKARVLIGPHAHVFDILMRVAPTHYHEVLSRVEAVLRRRSHQSDQTQLPQVADVLTDQLR